MRKLTKCLDDPEPSVPMGAIEALRGSLPVIGLASQVRARHRVGMGSLGRPRYVALAEWAGGWIAREAKAVTLPATTWKSGADTVPRLAEVVTGAVRSPDPFYRVAGTWVVRRRSAAVQPDRVKRVGHRGCHTTTRSNGRRGSERAFRHSRSVARSSCGPGPASRRLAAGDRPRYV